MVDPSQPSAITRGLRHGLGADPAHGAVVPPWYPSTNYRFDHIGGTRPEHDYSRGTNPTRTMFAEALATLEGGTGAVVTASGMAACTLAIMALVPVGGRVVAAHDLYGGTWRLLDVLAQQGRISLEWVDLTDPDASAAALARPADLVWIETPSNPLLRITDIAATCALAHDAGALALVDNTFCSPLLQQPLSLGADLVLHSTTKFINGHSDVIGGAVIAARQTEADQLGWWANTLGLTGGSFDAWLALRGLRTLDARLRVHQANTNAVLEVLTSHPAVAAVHHPGLASHPGHELAARQQRGPGSLLSFELVGGLPAARAFADGLVCFDLAESLGGTESLVVHPATMTHAAMSPEAQARAGITEGLVRLSVGIEQADDLVADVRAGLDRAAGRTV